MSRERFGWTSALPDVYTLRARVLPVLLIAAPLAVAAFAWSPGTWSGLTVGAGVWCVFATVLAQLGRERGRRSQAALFASWGGSPTTRLLRHRETKNATQLLRRHEQLAAITGLRMPTAEEEADDSVKADEIYDTCVGIMTERTRDKKTFDIIFDENCSFGFRRNLWALKPFGVAIALGVLVAVALYLAIVPVGTGVAAPFAVLLISLLALISWKFVTTNWVAHAGDAYAEALLAASERVNGTMTTKDKRKPAKTGRGRT